MIPVRPTTPPIPPLKVALLKSSSREEESEEDIKVPPTNQNQSPNTSFFLLRYFKLLRISILPTPLTPRTILAMSIVREMRCTPRSYNNEMEEIFTHHSDPRVSRIYLTKALTSVPLSTLTNSHFFWGHDNFSHVCELLVKQPGQFRKLLEVIPPEKYNYIPGQCKNEEQIQILLEVALGKVKMLEEVTDAVLIMIGEPRNEELDKLYYFYLKMLMQRQGTDAYIAERVRSRKKELKEDQITALRKIENASHLQNAIDENLSGS
jgi:hypothetical protein